MGLSIDVLMCGFNFEGKTDLLLDIMLDSINSSFIVCELLIGITRLLAVLYTKKQYILDFSKQSIFKVDVFHSY